jgi:hypothetical protein
MTAVRPSVRSRGATLRLAGVLVAASGVLQLALSFLPVGPSAVAGVLPIVLAGLLAAAAVVLARGADGEGGLAGRRGAAALVAFAVLLLLGPVVRFASGVGDSLTVMIGSSYVSLAIDALAVIAAAASLLALAGARAVPHRVVVVPAVVLLLHVIAGVLLWIPALSGLVPSQATLIALSTIGSLTETLSLLVVGVVWLLAGRPLR